MKTTLICIGKLKEKYLKEAAAEYLKRLSSYTDIEIIELPDEKAPEALSEKGKEAVLKKEGNRILERIPGNNPVIVTLEIRGKSCTSEELSDFIKIKMISGGNSFCFIIGGSLGLSPEVSARSDFQLSLSKMTFPHQLTRIILLEQIYRAFKIMKNEPYHK